MLALAWATPAPSSRCWDSMTLGTAMLTGSSILSGWAKAYRFANFPMGGLTLG